MMDNLVELFCVVDDFAEEFFPEFEKIQLEYGIKRSQKPCSLTPSEIITIMIYFHQLRFRDFKTYYTQYVQKHLGPAFPKLVSYNRFVELMPSILMPLCFFIHTQSKHQTGIYFVDATTINVCHVKRASANRVFKGIAKKGKSSMGWFFGFKLHLVINDKGEIMAFKLTQATTDDRAPVDQMTQGLSGKMIGDKGYISQTLFDKLYQRGLQLITKIKKNMHNKLMPLIDKLLLRKRAIIESVNDQLKNISQIEHSRYRSVNNFMVNLLAGLAAYALQPKKPSLDLCSNFLIEA
ncbi:IS982 family transposase [Legionella sp. CNM-1927-20]|uniref:IS982 family transposase n=1 Tax=Legionella sp. CNM-1927-20 TaxID=3422221 RepID=UPI00403B0B8C